MISTPDLLARAETWANDNDKFIGEYEELSDEEVIAAYAEATGDPDALAWIEAQS